MSSSSTLYLSLFVCPTVQLGKLWFYGCYHTRLLFKIFSGDTIQFGEGKFEYHDDIFGDQVILD